jgi:hypothetical protein
MTYTAKVTLKFDSTWDFKGGIYDDEMLPEEHITMEVPAEDLNTIQLFKFFSNFMRAIGHNEIGIMKGACYAAFNDMQDEENMRKIAEEFDLKLSEDYCKELRKLEDEIYDLKAKISRLEQPENPQYTDEEMNAMMGDVKYYEWNGLVPGSPEAVAAGCTCPVMDNEEMPENRKWVNGDCPLHGRKTTA